MPTINTLRGPVDTASLGRTLMHEHVAIRTPGIGENWPELWVEDREVDIAEKKLNTLSSKGIGTIVDLTTADMGRDLHYLKRVAERTTINVVLATGVYWIVPRYWWNREADDLTRVFVKDITEGIQGSDIKAGIIKLASDHEAGGVSELNEKCLRAGARAHRATGVPIATHNNPPELGREQQRVFKEEGVDLTRIVIGHVGDTSDTGYLKELMDNGSYVGMDRFGMDFLLPFEDRVNTVATLCKDGYADRIVLSHDASCALDWIPDRGAIDTLAPNWHYNHIIDDVVPALLERGVTQEQVDTMLIHNPRTIFERQGAY
ncbi:MAG: phosphotriesterase [Hyphomicrobiales bacterium]